MIDLDELAARVQGQGAGVGIKRQSPSFVTFSLPTGRVDVTIYERDGALFVPSLITHEDREFVRIILVELDRQQSTPTDQPA